ncbi:MAG: class I SAM-dependent methyltransferase [Phormidesmis sp. RL_2_1]|nr:class I SAM-dependent methyltransferase [Phormidesmis sp. RL_2_1]
MITLYARSLETQQPDSLFQDPKAVEIAQATDYDFEKYAKGWASKLSTVIRVQEFDCIAKDFLQENPNAIVINLGCGLCTRFTRIDNGSVRWYEVDFPEVIALRRQFFEESDRYHFIAKSILDFTWIDTIQRQPGQPLLILMEGVSPYLSETENRDLISHVQARLAPLELVFDALNRKTANRSKKHDTVSKTEAEFKSGIDSGQELEAWNSNITLKNEIYYLKQFADYPQRLPLWARYLSPLLVILFKSSSQILQLKIE